MPGLEEALSALRRRGIPFGVVSSSWRWYVERCLRELDMSEDAAVIVTGSDGLRAAVAAGLACAAVYNPDSGAQDLSPVRWRLNSLYELPALLDGN